MEERKQKWDRVQTPERVKRRIFVFFRNKNSENFSGIFRNQPHLRRVMASTYVPFMWVRPLAADKNNSLLLYQNSGRRESNADHKHPMLVYYHYTTARVESHWDSNPESHEPRSCMLAVTLCPDKDFLWTALGPNLRSASACSLVFITLMVMKTILRNFSWRVFHNTISYGLLQ